MTTDDRSPTDETATGRGRIPKRRRWQAIAALTLLGLLVSGELLARFWLGLGDPPLYISDPKIGYLFAPSRQYQRFGNRVQYNAFSMRSDERWTEAKTDPDQLRVLFLGDSIVNGGSLTDQRELATERLQQRLTKALEVSILVGNVSAGSWGPINQLAYVEKFGLFDADLVVIVLSGHDIHSVPSSEPSVGVRPEFPDRSPLLALQEVLFRYLPKILSKYKTPSPAHPDPKDLTPRQFAEDYAHQIRRCEGAMLRLLEQARRTGSSLIVAVHPKASELTGPKEPSYGHLVRFWRNKRIEPIELDSALIDAINREQHVYRDPIHLNAEGQRVLAEVLYEPILRELKRR